MTNFSMVDGEENDEESVDIYNKIIAELKTKYDPIMIEILFGLVQADIAIELLKDIDISKEGIEKFQLFMHGALKNMNTINFNMLSITHKDKVESAHNEFYELLSQYNNKKKH